MKNRNVEWKKKKYIQACNLLDYINQKANFCNIRTINCSLVCNGQFDKTNELCCSDCIYLSEKGCKIKSIGCKLYFCFFGLKPSTFINLNEQQKIYEKQFIALRNFIINFMIENEIPIHAQRMSMKDNFLEMGILIEEEF